jgi:hypothetical protein
MGRKQAPRKKRAAAKRRGIGCLFWLCLAAILVAVGFVAREPIRDAWGRIVGARKGPPSTNDSHPTVTVTPLAPSAEDRDGANSRTMKESRGKGDRTSSDAQASQTQKREAMPPRGARPPLEAPSAREGAHVVRKARLFFVSVDEDGTILMKGVIRPIPAGDSPLRDSMETLLKGPTAQEINLGLLSMIPSGARLRGVAVKGDTAVLDFNEDFRFNSLGMEGLKAQLRQVVYAATELPTVKKVQILIEGKKVGYLGTEGIRIDEPLSRSSFPQ